MDIMEFWQSLVARPDFWGFMMIPVTAAVVTWVHVWMAMQMVFLPLEFVGYKPLYLGWQGIIPRKTRKMAGIVVDKTLTKLGSLDEVFREMEPERIAEHVSRAVLSRIEDLTDEIMSEKNAVLWENLPNVVKNQVYSRMRRQIPGIMDNLVQAMSANINDLVDIKDMVIRQLESDKGMMVRVFREVGGNEIRFVVNASFWIGLGFGLVQMILWYFVPWHMGLPLYAAVLGALTNWLALTMVFRPLHPIKIGPWSLQGVFLKRQDEVADHFARLTTMEMLSIRHIMVEILTGPRSDRTKLLIKKHMRPLLDSGMMRTTAQMALGVQGYMDLKDTIADKAVQMTMGPISEPAFNRDRAKIIERIFSERMRALTSGEFQDLLRPAFQEDEWIFVVLGAVTGLIAGSAQLMLGFH